MKDLKDKIALVTGGSRGIGRAISLQLAERGAKVIVNFSSSPDKAQAVVSEIEAAGGSASAIKFDVSNAEEVEVTFKSIGKEEGGLDILVNNAGIAVDGLLLRTKPVDWQKTISVNLSGAFYCTKFGSKLMLKRDWGRIIMVSSVIGEMGNAGQAAYSASKSGLFGLVKSVAKELGSRQICVNAVTPGFIETDMTSEMDDEARAKLVENIALGYLAKPEDVANLVSFLSGPEARYITGQIVGINGGLNM